MDDQIVQEFFEKFLTKKNAIGYFFVIGEVVHPFYLDCQEDFEIISEAEAWWIICNDLLDFSFATSMRDLKDCFLRGKVTDRIEIGNLADFYIDQVKKVFKTSQEFEVVENPDYRIRTLIEAPVFVKIRNLIKTIPYLSKLPWEVKSHLSSQSLDVEKKIINRDTLESRLRIVHARLGALKRQNAIQAGQNISVS